MKSAKHVIFNISFYSEQINMIRIKVSAIISAATKLKDIWFEI